MKLNQFFSSGMVLQRDIINRIYGTDEGCSTIYLYLDSYSFTTQTKENGQWEIQLPPQANGGPFEITIVGSKTIRLRQIYFGDVFLLSGQSNMELPLSRVRDLYKTEIRKDIDTVKSSKYSNLIIYQFSVEQKYAFSPQYNDKIKGRWSEIEKDTLMDMSAVGYFYAKEYQKRNQVNVGLIQTSLGGSPIEAWCDDKIIHCHRSELMDEVQWLQVESNIKHKQEEELDTEREWYSLIEGEYNEDWKSWDKMNIPCKYKDYEKLKDLSGLVWIKKIIELNETQVEFINNEDVYLYFGTIVDKDDFYINGTWIGNTDYQYPPRKYYIPKGTLKIGKNIIMIKHIVEQGQGEFTSAKPYHIMSESKKIRITLRGEWHYYIGKRCQKKPSSTFFTWKATALFYGMIYPLRHVNLKGILWYQGESNVEDNVVKEDYNQLLVKMIALYRLHFRQTKLPFVSVLLAGYGNIHFEKGPGKIANFRQEQLKILSEDGVGIASATDLGEFNDIHPLRKKELGRRLAITMGRLLNYQDDKGSDCSNGPTFSNLLEDEKYWILEFESVGKGLVCKTLPLFVLEQKNADQWLVLCGEVFEYNKVKILKPVAYEDIFRIAHNHIDCPNIGSLYNSDMLPCLPFVIDLK